MKSLSSKRVLIQPLTIKDGDFLFVLMNTPKWIEFIGDRGIKNVADAKKYLLTNIIPSYNKHGFGLCKVSLRDGSTSIGICGLLKRDYLIHPDLGFAILPGYEGKGYAIEASMTILAYAKNELRLKRILAITLEANAASIGLLKKLGFQNKKVITREKEQLLILSKNL